MTDKLIIKLPFCGFYESMYSQEIDHTEERDAEYMADERQEEEGIPQALRLDAGEFSSILFDVTKYSEAYLAVAKMHVDALEHFIADECDLKLGLAFESMTSPREYNFQTDRLFAHIPLESVQALFRRSEGDRHERLAAVIKERCTSRSGFHSYYPNDLESWLEKPVAEWDHNELEMLLLAIMPNEDDWSWRVFQLIADGEGFHSAWSDAVDWPAFDRKVQEARDAKAAELAEDDPDFVTPAYRCQHTLDLFTGREG